MEPDEAQWLDPASHDARDYFAALQRLPDGAAQIRQLMALVARNNEIVRGFAADLSFDSSPHSFTSWLASQLP